jgi:hypothetical protein
MQQDFTQLPPHKDEVNGHIRVDIHWVLFAFNALFVLIGYYATTQFNALAVIKITRILLMGTSFATLLLFWRKARFKLNPWRHSFFGIFLVANLAVVPFSVIPSLSLERLLTVAPFWLYVNLFAYYLRGRYGPTDGLRRIAWMFLLVYLFPVFIFFTSGNPFSRFNIYGEESSGFVSNQLGWASAVAVACLIDIRARLGASSYTRMLWFGALGASFWLLLISGSRSSYLSVAVTILMVLTASRTMSWALKGFISILIVLAAYGVLTVQDSAVAQRLQKTQTQLERIEPRVLSARQAFHTLNTHEERYITGVGFDLYDDAILILTGVTTYKAHNSYLEMFVNCGFIVFGLFFLLFILPTLARYAYFDARLFSFLPPILIIPYFENNLGAGQFYSSLGC